MPEPADLPLLNPAALLGDRVERLPSRAVVVFDESHVPKRKRRRRPAPFRQVAITGTRGSGGSGPEIAVVATVGPGGPTAAVTVEFLSHLGVKTMVSVGVAGDLFGDRSRAMVFPVSASVAEDGTSLRYGSHLTADERLLLALVDAVGRPPVVTVSTDTPLRHNQADITRFRTSARLIEMETAALFSAANRCGMTAGALLVPSDGYHTTDQGIVWSIGDPDSAKTAVAVAVKTAVSVLAAHSPEEDPAGDPEEGPEEGPEEDKV